MKNKKEKDNLPQKGDSAILLRPLLGLPEGAIVTVSEVISETLFRVSSSQLFVRDVIIAAKDIARLKV